MRGSVRRFSQIVSLILFLVLMRPLAAQEERRDIETASFYELTDWLRELNLSEAGTIETLRQRLMDYYGLEPDEQALRDNAGETPVEDSPQAGEKSEDPVAEEARLQVISIESARGAEAFTVEAVEESCIVLRGAVILRVREEGGEEDHTLQADEVIFNQKKKRITARGNVLYQQGAQRFTAREITFHVETWAGLFIQGRSERKRSIDGEEILFYFMGDKIYTADKDMIILEGGTITSSDPDKPLYRIDATRVWLLGPGEWGLSHGVLYIGRIPVFYLPFFYNPGDEVFFNPVIGYRVKEGSYLQTTTYLYGRKQTDESALSFMKIATEEGQPREQERVGLFLKNTETPQTVKDKGYFKVMADYYSNLGLFAGFSGQGEDLLWANNLEMDLGIARSRNIYPSTNPGLYSPYDTAVGTDGVVWHDMPVPWGGTVPLRWGWKAKGVWKNFSLRGAFYSDPFFTRDFYDRAETFNWIDYLYREDVEQESTEAETSSYDWVARGNWSAPLPPRIKPWISQITLNQIEGRASWLSKTDPGYEALDPRSTFYYLDTLEFPSLRVSMKGSLFQYPSNAAGGGSKGQEMTLLPPWKRGGEERENSPEKTEEPPAEEGDDSLIMPDYINVSRETRDPQWITSQIDYGLYTQHSWLGQTDSDNWNSLADTDWQTDLGLYNTYNKVDLNLKSSFLDETLIFQDTTYFDHRYRMHENLTGYEEADWQNLLEGDYQNNRLRWVNSLSLQAFPLKRVPYFEKSRLQYSLDNTLFEHRLKTMEGDQPVFENQWIDGTKETFDKHEITAALIVAPGGQTQSLTYRQVLSPRDELQEFSWKMGYQNDLLRTSVSEKITYQESSWDWGVIQGAAGITPSDFLLLENTLQFDPQEQSFPMNQTRGRWGPLTVALDFKSSDTFRWETLQWEVEEEDVFHLTRVSANLNWQPQGLYLWYNRIFIKPRIQGQTYFNIDRINDSRMNVDTLLEVRIAEFLHLNISTRSTNTIMYRYLPGVSESVFGLDTLNMGEDLLKSFDFFNLLSSSSRRDSHFNLEKLSLDLVHKLGDWDLSLSYSADIELKTNELDEKYYDWVPELSLVVQWNPIPEIIADIEKSEDDLKIKTRPQ